MNANNLIMPNDFSECCRAAADDLYAFICRDHLTPSGGVIGPDSGLRWNLRIWRFVKSAAPWWPWNDTSQYHLQTQGYWILANLDYYKHTGNDDYFVAARNCADIILSRQTDGGHWLYDNPDWGGRITTVDGCFASLGVLAVFNACGEQKYLDAAKRWYNFMVSSTGFVKFDDDSLSLNYFANHGTAMIPNNSTLGLWFIAEMHSATREDRYLEYAEGMINFLTRCQTDTGELPYSLTTEHRKGKMHYLCFQYHAFQFMDIADYYQHTRDERIMPVMQKLAVFLENGLSKHGDAMFDCHKARPIVHYYTAAVAAALLIAGKMGLGNQTNRVESAYRRLVSWQRRDGGFDYSRLNYAVLCDRRSYPRMQAMLLRHLLVGAFNGDVN